MNIKPKGQAVRRRAEILRLVRSGPVRSQEELQHLLRRRGFEVAQPTLSRDVRDLGLARTPTGYAAPSEPPPYVPSAHRGEALERALGRAVLSIQPAGTLVVFRTPPAAAQPVARVLDEAELPGVVGTIAGDDTVFVATLDASTAQRLARRLAAPLTSARPRQRASA